MEASKLNQKTYQYVFEYFSEQILSGKLKLNDRIPPERDIAEKLGVICKVPSGRVYDEVYPYGDVSAKNRLYRNLSYSMWI